MQHCGTSKEHDNCGTKTWLQDFLVLLHGFPPILMPRVQILAISSALMAQTLPERAVVASKPSTGWAC